jgi:sugar lactone lactonase YvrE
MLKQSLLALSMLLSACALPQQSTGPISPPRRQQPVLTPENSAPLAANSLDSAQARIQTGTRGDTVSLRVVMRRPLRAQNLELERITHLRAWVNGRDLPETRYNLNGHVAIDPQAVNTELRIEQVPRGTYRVVSVQGYDNTPGHAAVPGALLKAIYSSPPDSTDVVLIFSWRSTATARIVEALQSTDPAVTGGKTPEQMQALLNTLDLPALESLLDRVIYGANTPQGSNWVIHPDRLNATTLAAEIAQQGTVPTLGANDPVPAGWLKPMSDVTLVVKTPDLNNFNSPIQVQITDPASIPVIIPAGQNSAQLPQIVPGTWEAIVKLEGLNGGVSTRATLTVSPTGQVQLTEGSDNNPLILPPVITALSAAQAASGTQLTLTGDGFNPAGGNRVTIGGLEAEVLMATATSLVVTVPADLSGDTPVQVSRNDKYSNIATLEVETRIVSMSAPGGKPGDTLRLNVSGFNAVTANPVVTFANGVQAEINTQLTTPGTLVVTVPPGASTGPISVTPAGGQTLESPTYTVNTPLITSLSPESGQPGALVTVSGVNLSNASAVNVNGTPVDNLQVLSDQVLTFRIPAGASSGPVQVTTPLGTANSSTPLNIPQQIVALSAPGGKVGDTLSLTVSGFNPVTANPVVTFAGGAQAVVNTQLTTPDTLVVTVPAGATTGPISVTPADSATLQSPVYTLNQPLITAMNPTSGNTGALVTVSGANLTGATAVTLNGLPVTNPQVLNDQTLTFQIPPGATTGPVQITTPQGSVTATTPLTIPTQIVSLSAPGGQPGDSLTITVSGFNPQTANPTVTFSGGAQATVTGTSANTVTVTVPVGATTGPITVTPQSGSPLQSSAYTISAPVVSSFTPTAAVTQPVVINGANLSGATAVSFNGVNATSFVVNNSGQITAVVPTGATDGPITVTTPLGTATSATPFNLLKPPTITGVAYDPLQPTAAIVLTGTQYTPTTTVMLGSQVLTPDTYTIDSPTQITIHTPPLSIPLEMVTVTNAAGFAVSSLLYKDVINFIGNANQVSRTDVNFQIDAPHGINVDFESNIYVASLNHKIYKFNQAGVNQYVSGDGVPGWRKDELTDPPSKFLETTLANARFNAPEDLANDAAGNIYVADTGNHAIRKITPDGRVQVLARVHGPEGIEISAQGELFVTGNDPPNGNATRSFVMKISDLNTLPAVSELEQYEINKTITANVSIVAGGEVMLAPAPVVPLSPISAARFLHLEGLGIDGQGNIYVADVDNYQIRKIDVANNTVTVLASFAQSYYPPTQNTDSRPYIYMHEIRVDPQGNVFVPAPCCDTWSFNGLNWSIITSQKIYKISPQGVISRIAGTGTRSLVEGKPLTEASFNSPRGVDFAPDGTLYIADTAWGIRRIDRYQPMNGGLP